MSPDNNNIEEIIATCEIDDESNSKTEPANKCEINNNSKCDDNGNDSKTDLENSIDLTNDSNEEESPKKVPETLLQVQDKYQDISENEDELYIEDEDLDQYYENEKSDLDGDYTDDGSDQEKKDRENGDGEEGNEVIRSYL